MQTGRSDLALVPVWAVRHHDQILARFDSSRESDVRAAAGRSDLSIRIRQPGGQSLELDGERLTAIADGSPLHLNSQGFRLLEHLVRADRIVPPEELMGIVWGPAHGCSDTTLRALVHRVRRSLPATWSPWLRTVRLQGYWWTDVARPPY